MDHNTQAPHLKITQKNCLNLSNKQKKMKKKNKKSKKERRRLRVNTGGVFQKNCI